MSIFWQAVKYLEKNNLKVIAATGDGASQDRKFFRMHKHLVSDSDTEILYRTRNIYTKEMRFIYFFSDVPDLMKTVRNCFFHSRSGGGPRYMWKYVFFFYGHIIARIYHEDSESGLKLVNKLTSDHINLTSYSVIKVNLAARVLSETVGNVINDFGPEEAAGTGKFCLMIDKFFDCYGGH